MLKTENIIRNSFKKYKDFRNEKIHFKIEKRWLVLLEMEIEAK